MKYRRQFIPSVHVPRLHPNLVSRTGLQTTDDVVHPLSRHSRKRRRSWILRTEYTGTGQHHVVPVVLVEEHARPILVA